MDIGKHLAAIKGSLPEGTRLVAVSKTKPAEVIMEAYRAGHKVFGENKAQEIVQKYNALPKDIEWHFIGHLQSNKAKYIAPFVSLIHGIDSFKILKTVDKEARKNNRIIPCLIQFHIAQEDSKFGFTEEEAFEMLGSKSFATLKNIEIAGVMGMATYTDNDQQVRDEFRYLKGLFDKLKQAFFSESPRFKEISMGMSDDYPVALEEGSTLIRVGSKIFGARNHEIN